jgi:hypothetical protein
MDEPSEFSRHTYIAAVEVLEAAWNGHSAVTRALLKLGADIARRCDSGSLEDRFNHLIKLIDEHPDRRLDTGDLLVDTLVRQAAATLPVNNWGREPDYSQAQAVLLRSLDVDGFTVEAGGLRRTLPAELGLPQARDDVTRTLAKYGFGVLQGHLDQALDAHGRGEWASANAQLRTFYEGLFDEIAYALDPTSRSLPSSENRRARLGALGFLDASLNEWSADGKNFVNGLFRRLHPSGSHPGLSDQHDSTFRRHVVLITAKLFLNRFDQRISPRL